MAGNRADTVDGFRDPGPAEGRPRGAPARRGIGVVNHCVTGGEDPETAPERGFHPSVVSIISRSEFT